MNNKIRFIKNSIITVVLLCMAFAVSLLFESFDVKEHITTVFVFAVFIISLLTDSYIYGISAAFIGTIAVNYAFTFPFFKINFEMSTNLISAIIMISVALLTSTLTTELKHHEAVKAESEREKMRANLLRAVSHDLRTPLTTIYSSGTTLLENSDGMTEEQKRQILIGINEDSEWLVRMVENLLSVTRIDSGQVKISKTPTVLEELIDSVMLKFKKRYPAQKVDIEIPDDVIIIPMDAILVEQVIMNLLENAVQHAVGMTSLALRVTANNKKAVFEIEDNGCGINPKKSETLFSGYLTTKAEIADSHKKNAGIGLSVCATIIKAHGGTIEAENLKVGGALFRFTLDTEDVCNDTE